MKKLTAEERALKKKQMRENMEEEEFKKVRDSGLTLPKGMEFWVPELGENINDPIGQHYFDIVPYWVNDKYPTGKGGNKEKGRNIDRNVPKDQAYHKLDLWLHYNIGAEYKTVPCLWRNYDEKCPICQRVMDEYRETPEEDKEGRKKIWRDGSAKRRTFFIVRPVDENQKRLFDKDKVFDVSYSYMDEKCKEKSNPPRGGKIYFGDPEIGKTIFFCKVPHDEKNIPYDMKSHDFVDRDYIIPDDDIDVAPSLDQCINYYSAEEIIEMDEARPMQELEENGTPGEKQPKTEETGDAGMKTKTRTKPSLTSKTEEKDEYAEFKVNGKFVACPDFEGDVDSEDNPFGRKFDNFHNCQDCPASKPCETKQKDFGDDVPF